MDKDEVVRTVSDGIAITITPEYDMEELLNYAFVLFESLEDEQGPWITQATDYFISNHNFDINLLPPKLHAYFEKRSAEDNKLDHEIDSAEDFPLDDLY